MDVPVPASLYAVSIVELSRVNRHSDGNVLFVAEVFRVVFLLGLNYLLTVLFTAQLGLMVTKQFELGERPCPMHFMVLIFCCTFIFEVSMLAHFEKCFNLTKLLWFADGHQYEKVDNPIADALARVRSAPDGSNELPKAGGGAILAQQKTFSSKLYMRILHPIHGDRNDQHGMSVWSLKGTSGYYRGACFVLIVLPKCFADLMLAYLGGLFVASTSEGDNMMLNTLAVVFISELDELMYFSFTSSAMRLQLENMKAVKLQLTNKVRISMWFFHSLVVPTVAVSFAFYLTRYVSGCHPTGSWDDLSSMLKLTAFFPRRGM